jgi:hypothetical protein
MKVTVSNARPNLNCSIQNITKPFDVGTHDQLLEVGLHEEITNGSDGDVARRCAVAPRLEPLRYPIHEFIAVGIGPTHYVKQRLREVAGKLVEEAPRSKRTGGNVTYGARACPERESSTNELRESTAFVAHRSEVCDLRDNSGHVCAELVLKASAQNPRVGQPAVQRLNLQHSRCPATAEDLEHPLLSGRQMMLREA